MNKLKTKTELMKRVQMGISHEVFEHSTEGQFDVTLMRAWAREHLEPVFIFLPDIIPNVLTTRIFEEKRVADIKLEEAAKDPALVVVYPTTEGNGEHLFIDGTHRAICLHRAGIEMQLAYFIPADRIIRPPAGFQKTSANDWGDEFVDGVLVKRNG